MATILRSAEREFSENPGRRDPFRLFSDFSQAKESINPRNLNFDLRQLNPGQFSSLYHFHRHAEELFMIISGSATLRTPEGFAAVGAGDLVFFEMGATGAHQLYNHTAESCVYLDVRSFMGHDIAEYPDSGKLLIVPTMEMFSKNCASGGFDWDEDSIAKWRELGFVKE